MESMLIQGRDKVQPAPADAPAAPLAPPPAAPLAPPPAAPLAPPPAVPDGPAGTSSRTEPVLDTIMVVGGLLCAAVGLTVMVAWFVRATAILRFGSQAPMSFNSALAFAMTGFAFVALARRRPGAVLAAGVFDAVLGALILAEYALGRDLGIDQLAVKAYLGTPHVAPGRPAINTAVCLVLAGAALLVWGPLRPRRRSALLAAAGCAIAVIAAIATFGYATGDATAYGWTRVTAMAFLTASTLLVLGLCMLSAAWRDSHARYGGLPRWLPVPVGALALGLAVWLAIAGRAVAAGRISQDAFTSAATALGLVMGGLVGLAVWLAQQSEGRRRVAVATAARRAEGERETRESENRLFQFLDVMPVGVFIASPGGRPYYASEEGVRLQGRDVAPGIGAGELAEAYRVFQAGTDRPYPTASLPIIQALGGRRVHVEDVEIHKPDGSVTPLEVWGRPVYGAGGEIDYAITAFADMTTRKDAEREALRRAGEIQALNATLEQRVQQRTVHLERANKNLAAFTYTAAHDLRTPLRAMSGFAEALVEEYGGRLDETGRGYAGRIQAASGHMATVLDDLLYLSQVSTAEMNLQDVDLSAEVTVICDRLRADAPGRRVRVTVQDGVKAKADRPLIQTVLENLLDNAWKFTVGRDDAAIEFAATPAEDAPLCCYVRDNGAGFDPAYEDKLFQPFQRLHAASEYAGTGTGLATVRRIIDRHGGRTWAEGAVGCGATFYFTLDAKDTQ
jgi:signal transduction histidine kinase